MSPDPNRQRPRSSKKRRAVQSGAATARPRPSGSGGGGSAGRRTADGRVRRGTATPASGGIPGAWLAIGAVVVFAVGVLLASGTIGGAGSSTPGGSRVATASGAGGSIAPRGTNCPTAQPPAAPAGQQRVVTIQTAKGTFEITLNSDLSPIAVGNFAALAACGYYNGIVFHRIATLGDGTPFVIQGGDPTGTGTGGPGYEIQDEPVTAPYVRGTVAMARTSAPNSVGSQFFVVLDDKDQSILASANTYQIIGSVTKGMETVDAIYQAAGGVENPPDPVVMTSVTIGPAQPAASPAASGLASPAPSVPAASISANPS